MDHDGVQDDLEMLLRGAPLKELAPGARQRVLAGLSESQMPPSHAAPRRRFLAIAAVIGLVATGVAAWRLAGPLPSQRNGALPAVRSMMETDVLAHRPTPLNELDIRAWRVLRAAYRPAEHEEETVR